MSEKRILLWLCCIYSTIALSLSASTASADESKAGEDPAVTNFRNYLQIDTSEPNPDYDDAITFLSNLASDIGLGFELYQMDPPNLFAIIITWQGSDPSLQAVVLNGHTDTAPVDASGWTYPPFGGVKDASGNIYGSGAISMKSTTIAELEAIRRLILSGYQPTRTILVIINPDEELGGFRGMGAFSQTQRFKDLNIGFDIDEGSPSGTSNEIDLYYAEKNAWKFNITATGISAHGSEMPKYTAAQRLKIVIDRLLGYRQLQYLELVQGEPLETVTSINLVRQGGGISDNTIPSDLWASFDMRIWQKPDWTFDDVDKFLNGIIREARLGATSPADDVRIDFLIKSEEVGQTVHDSSNPWWNVMQQSCTELNVNCPAKILISSSDARFFRSQGISAFGVSVFPNTENTANQYDEFINEANYLQGIDRLVVIIRNLAGYTG